MADANGRVGAWASFKADIGRSLSAWKAAPALPVLTLVLTIVETIPAAYPQRTSLSIFALPVLLFSAGFNGTQRLWYLRLWRGRNLSAREVWFDSWSYLGRFLWLGLVSGLLAAPVVVVIVLISAGGGISQLNESAGYAIGLGVIAAVFDVILTFVTPALAFSTGRVGEAFKTGVRFLRQRWPENAWYALIPPLAFTAVGRLTPQHSLASAPRLVLLSLIGPVALLLKGASAAYYLRFHEVGENGALRMAPDTPVANAGPPQPERPR